MAQLHNALSCVSCIRECYGLTHQCIENWSANVCAILLQTLGKHFLKADTVRKKEIQGRMARKLRTAVAVVQRVSVLPQC